MRKMNLLSERAPRKTCPRSLESTTWIKTSGILVKKVSTKDYFNSKFLNLIFLHSCFSAEKPVSIIHPSLI